MKENQSARRGKWFQSLVMRQSREEDASSSERPPRHRNLGGQVTGQAEEDMAKPITIRLRGSWASMATNCWVHSGLFCGPNGVHC